MPRSLALVVFSLGTVAMTATGTAAFSLSSGSSTSKSRSLAPLHVSSAVPTTPEFSSSHQGQEDDDHHHYPAEALRLPHGVHAPVTVINSPFELAEFLEHDDRLCVIKFHAAWCKSCQRFGRKFQILANQKADWVQDSDGSIITKEGAIRLASIEFGANMGMCRSLNIKRLPTVQFYQKGQQLDGFPCGPSKFPRLLATIDRYLQQPQAGDDNDDDNSLAATLQKGNELMNSEEVAGVLQDLKEQEANGALQSKTTKTTKRKRAWWNPMP